MTTMKTSDIHIRDPYILPLPDEGRYLLFGTTGKNAWSGPGLGFDCYESRDLVEWQGPIPAFRPPADFWSNTQFWAPECHPWQGRYFLFASFAKDERQRGTQILVADRPEGPYRPHSDGPVTPRDWECLDGTLFVDDAGKPWMVFCHEWVQVEDGEMCAIPLSDDLRGAAGQPTLLFRASEAAWAKPFAAHGRPGNRVTDGPYLHRLSGGGLLMLWSTLGHKGYAMGYAVSDSGSVLGPWRQSDAPIYSRDGGHGMLFHDFGGRLRLALHQPNNSPNERPLWLEVVENGDGLAIRDSANLYPAPDGIAPSHRYAVTVNGMASFTYLTTGPAKAYYTAGHTASWTSFDVRGRCEVRIRRPGRPVREAAVRPLAAGILPRIEGDDVVLELDRPRKLCVECDGDLTDVLFLFANAPETDVPSPGDPNVVWFGPGVHEIGKYYPLKPATTYYLAPGAFLKGSFAGGGDGTRVIGRGVLSGADYGWPGDLQEKNPDRVDLVKLAGDGLELTGVTLVDSPYYVVIAGGRNNRFSDLKILAWHSNTDGISAGSGARIDDCFLRVADDAFKPFVSDTRISRCVLWVDKASVFQLTWNALRDCGGSEVRDCDVIHHMPFCTEDSEWVGAVFWSWHGGHAHIHDLLFEDIRIEGRSPCLLRLFMRRNPWSPQQGEWGRFSRLVFRNIACDQPFRFPNRLLGHDAGHPIADVTIENLTIAGCRIDLPTVMNLQTNEFVQNLQIR